MKEANRLVNVARDEPFRPFRVLEIGNALLSRMNELAKDTTKIDAAVESFGKLATAAKVLASNAKKEPDQVAAFVDGWTQARPELTQISADFASACAVAQTPFVKLSVNNILETSGSGGRSD
eukprot:9861516-Alexandrium_andersonii.AAC.1